MAPVEPPSAITLKVKVPAGHISAGSAEFSLGSIPITTPIADVRTRIQQLLPSHPSPERQRILYLGHPLVVETQTLAEALKVQRTPTQTEYVVHLIVRGEGLGTPSPTPTPPVLSQGRSSTPTVVNGPPTQMQQATAAMMEATRQYEQVAQRHMQHVQAQMHGAMAVPPQLVVAGPQYNSTGGTAFAMPVPSFGQQAAAQGHGQHQLAAGHMQGPGGSADSTTQSSLPQQHLGSDASSDQAPATGVTSTTDAAPPASPALAQTDNNSSDTYTLPNGQRVRIQQRVNISIPQLGITGQAMSAGGLPVQNILPQLTNLMPQAGFAGMAHPQQQLQTPQTSTVANGGQSALDRARDNMIEMRRMLEEMRSSAHLSEEDRARISNLQERVQSVNDYIDPFHLHGVRSSEATSGSGITAASPSSSAQSRQQQNPQSTSSGPGQTQQPLPFAQQPLGVSPFPPPPFFRPQNLSFPHVFPINMHPFPGHNGQPHMATGPNVFSWPSRAQQPPTNPSDITCYLISSPQGPQALLLSPQYGTYTSTLARGNALNPTSTVSGSQPPPPHGHGQQILDALAQAAPNGDPVAAAAALHMQDANALQQRQNAENNALRPLQPLFNHMWLLLRILIFAYFLLGANMGWRRPLAMILIGVGFWLVRMGLFGEGRPARRWWDGIVQVPGHLQLNRPQDNQANPQVPEQTAPPHIHGEQAQQPERQQQQQQQQQGGGPNRMPTPEQVAQRLIDERNARQNARLQQLRETVRPVERAVALFFASLWPGVGEAHVRAREQEERRRNEEEIAARRRANEERQKREEDERKAKESEMTGGGEKGEASTANLPDSIEEKAQKVGNAEAALS
ncbi:hypothetical protein M433DRAFT_156302 [Acidomyces richmondensis BFW]|nr:MAG: hypothetical protein FE78DRAFT_93107 [Acidomyces sp. 'richmondensis']KYG43807.1 hypothetical protein M433DRAFT_156302 [Acidomyces richmondensis BFW]